MDYRFESLLAILLDGEWIAIDSGEAALELLYGYWPRIDGPSYIRACKSCRAFVAGEGSQVAAKATLAVAAMEAVYSSRSTLTT